LVGAGYALPLFVGFCLLFLSLNIFLIYRKKNLSSTIALQCEVPNKIWFAKDVSYDHLRVFGCKVFVHVPKDERSKLDAKTREVIFVGYGQNEFGYRL